MFDFEKLMVYSKAKDYNRAIDKLLQNCTVRRSVDDQLTRASFSILLNIAEGTGRFTNKDKRHFYVVARGSVFECVAILDYMNDLGVINNSLYAKLYSQLEEISKMLFAMTKGLS